MKQFVNRGEMLTRIAIWANGQMKLIFEGLS